MLNRLRVPGLGGWSDDPLWGHFYDWTVEHPRVGGAIWRAGIGSDLARLYGAAAEIGTLPAGATVLDVPCGGGVALRGLKPGQGLHYVAADISELMLRRTMDAAAERGVADQVEPTIADVHQMQFDDGAFDLVVSFTGLHCFPDPHRALLEMGRVTRIGGVLTGSTLIKDSLRSRPLHAVGRAAGLLGPGILEREIHGWAEEAGFVDVAVSVSGLMAYFRGIRG
ncbi:MAG: class I SAM-dependent methyltransferase [Candidatus Dormibacteria bacterium]